MTTQVPGAEAMDATTARQAVDVIRRAVVARRFLFNDERDLQDGIEKVFTDEKIGHRREAEIEGGRIDFLAGAVGIEVKVGGSLAEVTRQLHRYAKCSQVLALVLISSRLRLGNLPESLNGKPLVVVQVGRFGF